MIDKIKSKVFGFIKKKRGGAEEEVDDELFKELGLDDDSLLSGDESVEDSDIFSEDKEMKKKKEKSLLSISYVFLGLALIISIAGSAVIIMSFNNQQRILDEVNGEKNIISNEIVKVKESIAALNDDGAAEYVDANAIYKSIFQERKKVLQFKEEFEELIDSIRVDNNIYFQVPTYTFSTENNTVSFNSETNSYTNMAKILRLLNESGLITGFEINGGQKSITADGVPTVPLNLTGKIVYPEKSEDVEVTEEVDTTQEVPTET